MLQSALRLFEPYWKKRDLELLKRECDQLGRVLGEYLDDIVDEQREHLRVMRLSGPWSADWELASRQRELLSRKVLRRLKRHRGMQQRLVQMEADLPVMRGLSRLRYHPWEALWALFLLASAVWVRVLTT